MTEEIKKNSVSFKIKHSSSSVRGLCGRCAACLCPDVIQHTSDLSVRVFFSVSVQQPDDQLAKLSYDVVFFPSSFVKLFLPYMVIYTVRWNKKCFACVYFIQSSLKFTSLFPSREIQFTRPAKRPSCVNVCSVICWHSINCTEKVIHQ